ncbi:uncharacterized protein LOC125536889 [Triticum urartu]|uniref:uncharacterized protein LOC125536889 n=1 Tax=Triticum urartu TaxID=4572 RepID=UPI002043C6D5|nr:uncharacterized protein LOC125536889 [Triticum urartu]
MCVNFTNLGKACPQDPFPLPRIDQIVDFTSECGLLCFLDAFSGYHQIKMEVEDEEKTAFLTPCGVYCYTYIPFGLCNAGATFQRLMHIALGQQLRRNAEAYVDDIVVKSREARTLIQDLEETFASLRQVDLRLNLEKCMFGVPSGKPGGVALVPAGKLAASVDLHLRDLPASSFHRSRAEPVASTMSPSYSSSLRGLVLSAAAASPSGSPIQSIHSNRPTTFFLRSNPATSLDFRRRPTTAPDPSRPRPSQLRPAASLYLINQPDHPIRAALPTRLRPLLAGPPRLQRREARRSWLVPAGKLAAAVDLHLRDLPASSFHRSRAESVASTMSPSYSSSLRVRASRRPAAKSQRASPKELCLLAKSSAYPLVRDRGRRRQLAARRSQQDSSRPPKYLTGGRLRRPPTPLLRPFSELAALCFSVEQDGQRCTARWRALDGPRVGPARLSRPAR